MVLKIVSRVDGCRVQNQRGNSATDGVILLVTKDAGDVEFANYVCVATYVLNSCISTHDADLVMMLPPLRRFSVKNMRIYDN